ncbi:MAG: polyprenyl synthetase family protein [Planctomycetes bacterium]|nr:polyprenyl synthetase family protein [Planctomycetota bacterium]
MSSQQSELMRLLLPVADGIKRTRETIAAQLSGTSPAVRDMVEHIGRFQGKQLRAALVLLCGDATSNSTDEHSSIAAVVEMIHLATLVHDDVLDGAEVRRRVACVNQRWDNQTAVLLGDFLYARAFALSTDLSSRMCSRVLAEATRRICVGEIQQAASRYDFEMTQERYEWIAGAKTATLYAAACELGARYPSGHDEQGARMRQFGWELGLAFQIIDDCLDLTATQQEVGKSVGTDVEDGKVTLPVLWAYARADESTRAAIRDIYTRTEAGDRVGDLRRRCRVLEGVEYARHRADELIHSALDRVRELPPSAARASLENIAGFVLERSW